jgi:hypothetical protein
LRIREVGRANANPAKPANPAPLSEADLFRAPRAAHGRKVAFCAFGVPQIDLTPVLDPHRTALTTEGAPATGGASTEHFEGRRLCLGLLLLKRALDERLRALGVWLSGLHRGFGQRGDLSLYLDIIGMPFGSIRRPRPQNQRTLSARYGVVLVLPQPPPN